MTKYRRLEKGEIIQAGDETDVCRDPWRDPAIWKPVHPDSIGKEAPDRPFVSHRQYRRPVEEESDG